MMVHVLFYPFFEFSYVICPSAMFPFVLHIILKLQESRQFDYFDRNFVSSTLFFNDFLDWWHYLYILLLIVICDISRPLKYIDKIDLNQGNRYCNIIDIECAIHVISYQS